MPSPGCSTPRPGPISIAVPTDPRQWTALHPAARGQGGWHPAGRLDDRRAVEVARTLGSSRVRFSTTAWAADSAAVPVLRAAGLHEARHFLRMVADLTGSQTSEPQWPEGVVPASYRQGADDPPLFDAFADSFSEHWGHEHPDEKGWWWDERDSPSSGFDPSLGRPPEWAMRSSGSCWLGCVSGKGAPKATSLRSASGLDGEGSDWVIPCSGTSCGK
jgi:hypothetical protein